VTGLSARLAEAVDALPLRAGMRVIEFGCGPGAMLREIARRVAPGVALGVDRSEAAIRQVRAGSAEEIAAGTLDVRLSSIEDFALAPGEERYDLAVALRVGALDGRHPRLESAALARIAAVLTPAGMLYLDGGDPLRLVPLPEGPAR
jgi:cyclopropane fatty-acyl-phospholipid synthase-like methyltransferase